MEYGLVALQFLAKRGQATGQSAATVREISDECNVPYDLLAKIMQELKRDGLISSFQGVRGGYALMMAPSQISLTRIVNALEKETSITECTSTSDECCHREGVCTIKGPMHAFQGAMEQLMSSMTVAQLL